MSALHTSAISDGTPSAEDMKDTIYKLQQRVAGYSTEAQVYQEGDDRINIEIPGVTDANKILEELGKPGSLTFQTEDGTTVLEGTDVQTAQAATSADSLGNSQNVVELSADRRRSKEVLQMLQKLTSENVLYIIYDNQVISAPTVQSAYYRRYSTDHRNGRPGRSRESGIFHPYRFSVTGTGRTSFQRCRSTAWISSHQHQY